jgi:hypothetical protein
VGLGERQAKKARVGLGGNFCDTIGSMTKVEGENQKPAEKSPRSIAIDLIKSTYESAGVCKSMNNWESEHANITSARGMGRMAVALGVLTQEEVEKFYKEYWDNRSSIDQNFPDRFGS